MLKDLILLLTIKYPLIFIVLNIFLIPAFHLILLTCWAFKHVYKLPLIYNLKSFAYENFYSSTEGWFAVSYCFYFIAVLPKC